MEESRAMTEKIKSEGSSRRRERVENATGGRLTQGVK